ncbi:MAG: hypothetical protein M3N39_05520 [Pseudomonadota bacterium]|nr:hypothetical protein [Pseudomonadota bacterium]
MEERTPIPQADAGNLFKVMIGALLVHGGLGACAHTAPPLQQSSSARFICEGGILFRVDFVDRRVRVTTRSGVHELDRRPSSIGRKYLAGETTFIIDEDRAVLTGADGGPFKSCHEI